MVVSKSPRPTEESNLDKQCQLIPQPKADRTALTSRRSQGREQEPCGGGRRGSAYLLPLESALEVSLSQPVYSMVTDWPAWGTAPEPSLIVVLVTPIVKKMCVFALELFMEGECGWMEEA